MHGRKVASALGGTISCVILHSLVELSVFEASNCIGTRRCELERVTKFDFFSATRCRVCMKL